MKKILYITLSVAAAAALASCAQKIEVTPENGGQVIVTASLDQSTKATLGESTGAFAFSSGDQIAICNSGSTIFTGATTSTSNTGTFAMGGGFDGSVSGIAGFPASLVSAMTTSSVTFTLPTSYAYSEVGGATADAAKVVVPMLGTYTAGNNIALKHAGAVVRVRLTNLAAGTVTITFPTNITGTYELTSVPTTSGAGILDDANLSSAGKTVTITGVPAVPDGSYVYVTFPVPTGTAPQNILVTNEPSDASASRFDNIVGSGSGLDRAAGYKLSSKPVAIATPKFKVSDAPAKYIQFAPGNLMAKISSYTAKKATADAWKFGGYFEYIGSSGSAGNYLFYEANDAACVGKWIDLFAFQGASSDSENRANGIIRTGKTTSAAWHGSVAGESVYNGCWNTNADNTEEAGYIQISNGGDKKWRPLTGAEMDYLLNTRTTSTLNGTANARFARAVVAGVQGLLVFPDNIGSVWNTGTMGDEPSDINGTSDYVWGTDSYTAEQSVNMLNAGIVFFPCAGYYNGEVVREGQGTGEYTGGRYWTGSATSTTWAKRFSIVNLVVSTAGADRFYAMTVRLVTEVTP